ncbi:DUF6183 family protein [Actinophytocola sp.]|uniref:DUF6183 family protein n=1 Tax=Actinophytocola sp. TaxID=1872138 RepID=UPI00389AA4D4
MSRIEEMLSELPGCSRVGQYRAEVDGWPVDRLEALGHAILASGDAQHWAVRSVLDHVLNLLALSPSDERAAAVVRVVADGLPLESVRTVAAMLAQGQRARVLVSVLAGMPPGDAATELGACLLHEMILRRMPVDAVAAAWAQRLAGHPLAELPLHSLPGETRVPLPHFGTHAKSHDTPFLPGRVDLITASGTVPAVARAPAPADLTSAVRTWLTRSNGRAEAAMCTLDPPVSPGSVGVRTIEALGLDCLAGGGLALRRASLDEVVPVLFAAAAYGGAYDEGLGGAYGREAAWRSLNALAGGSHVGCAWWLFDAANDWFQRIAWDLGVLCLRPGGHVMAVLASTDSD